MPVKIGHFQFRYSQREQKQRDVLEYLVARYGIAGANIRISTEAHAAAWQFDLPSEQYQWWFELKTMLHNIEHSLAYGRSVGL